METNQTAPEADSETPGSGPVPEDAMGSTGAAGAADATSRSAAAGPHADGAVGSAPGPSRDAHGGDPADRAAGPGFYAWLRRLGVPRRAGWLGGVCAGVGARIGVDPIVVRGIVVVIAVLGAPFVLVYAIAWLLLPDTEGEIHLERLTRGIVDPAIVGIAVMGVIGFIPLVQGGWLGWRWWPDWPITDPILGVDISVPIRILWTLLLVGAIVALVVWLVRRASQNAPVGGASRVASAPAAGPGYPQPAPDDAAGAAQTAGAAAAGVAAAAAFAPPAPPAAGAPSVAPTLEPPVPAEGADAATIAEWRAQHEAWRESHAEWKAGRAEADRAARQQAAEETRAKAREFQAAAAAARAARRAARPRASAAFVFTVLGLAVVAGAAAAIWALGVPDAAEYSIAIAFATATLVFSAAMIVAAFWRRRSGALATLASLSLVAMLVSTVGAWFTPYGTLVGPGQVVSLGYPQQLVQPIGDAYVSFGSYDGYPDEVQVITLTQGTGDTYLRLDANAPIVVDASEAGAIDWVVIDDATGEMSRPQFDDHGDRVFRFGDGDGGEPADARFVLRQNTGSLYIEVHE